MCGPSAALKAVNANIQDFAKTVQAQSGEIFSDASSVFHDIMDSVTGILKGGPSAFGYSANELAAKNAAAVQAGAAESRNLRAAAASAVGAIGGGNVVMPAGATQATVLSAEQKAAADTAAAKNEIIQGGYEAGRENFFKGAELAERAPSVFGTSIEANKNVAEAQRTAMQSQQNIDTQSNWAMNDVMKLGTAAVSSWAGGGFKLPSFGGGNTSSDNSTEGSSPID